MTRAHLLRLNLRFVVHGVILVHAPTRRGGRHPTRAPTFGGPGVGVDAGEDEGPGGVAVSVSGLRRGQQGGAVAVGRQILVELVDVEPVDGADDVGAQLRDVHVAEVDVLTAAGRSRTRGAALQRPQALVFVP